MELKIVEYTTHSRSTSSGMDIDDIANMRERTFRGSADEIMRTKERLINNTIAQSRGIVPDNMSLNLKFDDGPVMHFRHGIQILENLND